MKKINIYILTLLTLGIFSCGQNIKVGEVMKVSQNDSIELFKYYYDEYSHPVIIARFKNKPVNTVNQTIQSGKTTYNQATVIIENDSIIVLRK